MTDFLNKPKPAAPESIDASKVKLVIENGKTKLVQKEDAPEKKFTTKTIIDFPSNSQLAALYQKACHLKKKQPNPKFSNSKIAANKADENFYREWLDKHFHKCQRASMRLDEIHECVARIIINDEEFNYSPEGLIVRIRDVPDLFAGACEGYEGQYHLMLDFSNENSERTPMQLHDDVVAARARLAALSAGKV